MSTAPLSEFGDCTAVPGDVPTADGAARLAAEAGDQVSALDLLVNNAGSTWGAELEDYLDDAWTKVLHTNLVGPFQLTVGLLGALRAAATPDRPARVINIGSINGIMPPALESYAYSTSKAGAHMLSRHLGARLATEHITVNTIAPGPFKSRMIAFALDDATALEALVGDMPLDRIGRPEDIAAAALYLTGTTLCVDGGITGCG